MTDIVPAAKNNLLLLSIQLLVQFDEENCQKIQQYLPLILFSTEEKKIPG